MRTTSTAKTDWLAILTDAVEKPGVISKAYSTFWNYSVGNQLSAMFQCMLREIEPGPIHTYRGWIELGRQVKRGEKAIVLTMPVTVKRDSPLTSVDSPPTAGPDGGAPTPTASRTIFVERPLWFVLSQTAGKEYVPTVLPEWDEDRALGTLEIVRTAFRHADGNCQGYAIGRQIAVSPIAFMPHRTLFHEVAHIVLGHTEESQTLSDGDEKTPRDIREVEAECVALICSESLGLPGVEFSRGYIQHWLHEQSIVEQCVHRIFKAADAILKAGRPVSSTSQTL